MQIWKFQLRATGDQVIRMPAGAEIISCQAQNGKVCLWATVDPKGEPAPRRFSIYGTGMDAEEPPGDFVGTVLLHGGGLVLHVFETTGQRPDGEGGGE